MYIYKHISFSEFADYMINYLFNIVGLVYIIGVKGFIPIFLVKSPVWLAHLLAALTSKLTEV